MTMTPPTDLVERARAGDVDAFARLVHESQSMVYGVARSVLRDPSLAQDATQHAYLRAWRRLSDLQDPAAFSGWLRRIAITVALNLRRSRRITLLRLDDEADVPVLDEAETHWSEAQRRRLAGALLTLSAEERQLCDRRYHGRWSVARLAATAAIGEAAMRKRLQRVRDKLRKEMEMIEQRGFRSEELQADLPGKVVELLARPRLTDLPENPVGRVLALVRAAFPDCVDQALPEVVDLVEARKTLAAEAMYVDPIEFHHLDERRILRYDLTLPLLQTVRYAGSPLRIWASGKAYRMCQVDATHLEAFHQAEVLWLDDRAALSPWTATARVLESVNRVLPGRTVKIVPSAFRMCTQAWDLEIENDAGDFVEVMAWGVYTDAIVQHLGGDPARHTAIGVGYGLERLAMLAYGIDDIRRVEVARVA
jgi:RNA polymerase sigma-70 factor (ECF subfamily)